MPNIVDDSRMADKLRNANVIDIGAVRTQRDEQAARDAALTMPFGASGYAILAVIGFIVVLLFLSRRM